MRFEDHSSCKGRSFCAGVILEKLHLSSPSDAEDVKEGATVKVIDKKVRLENLGLYWDWDVDAQVDTASFLRVQECMEVPFLHNAVPAALQCFLPCHFLLKPVSLSLQLHIDLRRAEQRRPSTVAALQATANALPWCSANPQLTSTLRRAFSSIMKMRDAPLSQEDAWRLFSASCNAPTLDASTQLLCREFFAAAWTELHTALPVVAVDADMSAFSVRVNHRQYCDCLDFVTSLSRQTLQAKYRQFKPRGGCASAREWWRFAVRAVVYNNQRHRRQRGWKHYLQFKRQREEYIELYKRRELPAALARLRKLEDKLVLEDILLFRRVALNEQEEERRGKKKALFARKGRKTLETTAAGGSEARRQELLTELGGAEGAEEAGEPSVWEEGAPTDRQVWVKFHLRKLSVCLERGDAKVVACKARGLEAQFLKRREFRQVWGCMDEVVVLDERVPDAPWRRVLYPMPAAQRGSVAPLLPADMLPAERSPFLQVEVQLPALEASGDVLVRGSTLPLGVVVNVPCVAAVVDFVAPALGSLDVYAFKQKEYTLFRQRGEKKRRFDVSKEIARHKTQLVSVALGAVHVVLPETTGAARGECQTLVLRLGDALVHCDGVPASGDQQLSAANAYDTLEMSLRDVTAVLVTGYAEDKVPGADGASLLRDFSVEARVGRCIAPSELELPTTRVELEAPTLQVRLGQRQYVALLQWLQGFTESMMKVLETSQSSQGVSQTSSQVVSRAVSQAVSQAASRLVDQVLTGLAAEKDVVPYSADELYVLQHNRLLSLRAVFQGIRVLLLEERAEETEVPLAELVLGALCVEAEKRSFDFSLHASLKELAVVDCLRSARAGSPQYLVQSAAVDEAGQSSNQSSDQSSNQSSDQSSDQSNEQSSDQSNEQSSDQSSDQSGDHLITVDFNWVKELSAQYAASRSNKEVSVSFGSLSGA